MNTIEPGEIIECAVCHQDVAIFEKSLCPSEPLTCEHVRSLSDANLQSGDRMVCPYCDGAITLYGRGGFAIHLKGKGWV